MKLLSQARLHLVTWTENRALKGRESIRTAWMKFKFVKLLVASVATSNSILAP